MISVAVTLIAVMREVAVWLKCIELNGFLRGVNVKSLDTGDKSLYEIKFCNGGKTSKGREQPM